MNATLQKLYSLFGRVVLLPIPLKAKKPLIAAWQKITFPDTQIKAYQCDLDQAVQRGGNLGVVLGPSSDGLMAIDIDRDQLVQEFLKLNPTVKDTTRTRGARGNQFFLRIAPGTAYPNTQAVYPLKDADGKTYGEWRCGGGGLGAQSIVFGMHPAGMNYQIVVDKQPMVFEFATIQWPFPWSQGGKQKSPGGVQQQSATGGQPINVQAVYTNLFATFGDPLVKTKQGYNINQPFFARLWGTKRLAFYDRAARDFYAYNSGNGTHERLDEDATQGLIRDDIIAEGHTRGFRDIAFKINAALLHSILTLIKTDAAVCQGDFFALDLTNPPVIHAANGMVHIETGRVELRPFSPDYQSRNEIPIDYDPDAECIHFKENLLEPVLSADDIDVLQRYCGLILIGGNRAQKHLILLGKGGTGKGTIVRLISLVIGRKNIAQLRVAKLNGRFETARFVGKLLLNVVEATADYLNQEGAEVMKALSGHDPMDGEKKNVQEPASFHGTFPIIITSNEKLNVRIRGDEEAQSRRNIIIEFNQRPAGSDIIDNYEQILFQEESEGIFAWMIEGAKKHWAELSQGKGFQLTTSQAKRVQDLIERSKSAETFLLNALDSTPTDDVTTNELYDAYCVFCSVKDWTPFWEQRFEEVSRYLIMRHFGISKRNDIRRPNSVGRMTDRRGYRGIKIK